MVFVCCVGGIIYNLKLSYEAKIAELEIKSWSLLTSLTEEMTKSSELRESILLSVSGKGMSVPKELKIKLTPNKIYLRLNEEFCMACYDSTVQLINDINEHSHDNPIGIISSFKSTHEYNDLIKDFKNHETIETFNMPLLDLGELDEPHMPYLFQTDEKGKIKSICLLIKGEEDLIQPYINAAYSSRN